MHDPHSESPRPDAPGINETSSPAAAVAQLPSKPKRRSGIGLGLIVLALIAASWFDNFWRAQELHADLSKQLEGAAQQAKDARMLAQQAQEAARDAQAKTALLEAQLAESQAQQAALETLYRDLTPGRDELVLTEIEQMLLLAGQQLQLVGNVQNALGALQAADARLQRLDRPEFTGLRRALAKDMDKLKAQPFVDVTGMSLRIDQILASIDKLPLALDERLPAKSPATPGSEASGRWLKIAREFWSDIQGLVRIEDLREPEPPLLAEQEQFFVRESVRLRLLTARQALIARDDGDFHADLRAAEDELRRYFDQRTKGTQVALTTLKQLQASTLSAELPDLAASLEAVRVLRLARDHSNR